MEQKDWKKYTNKEQKDLLKHWWHYYGKDIYNLAEEMQVMELIEKKPTQIFTLATLSYIDGISTKQLIKAMRTNKVEELMQKTKRKAESPDIKEHLVTIKKAFIDELVKTYNNPELDIKLEQAELLKQLEEIMQPNEEKPRLTSDKVKEIFKSCMFKDQEIKDHKPTAEYTLATGVLATTVFNTKKLNEHKKEINQMLDQIKDIENGPHFTNLCIDKEDNLWTGEHAVVDQLLILGLATELLTIPLNMPRDMWSIFPSGLPYVLKNNEKVSTPVVGMNPQNFPAQKKKK